MNFTIVTMTLEIFRLWTAQGWRTKALVRQADSFGRAWPFLHYCHLIAFNVLYPLPVESTKSSLYPHVISMYSDMAVCSPVKSNHTEFLTSTYPNPRRRKQRWTNFINTTEKTDLWGRERSYRLDASNGRQTWDLVVTTRARTSHSLCVQISPQNSNVVSEGTNREGLAVIKMNVLSWK